jgi:hypothetical protein
MKTTLPKRFSRAKRKRLRPSWPTPERIEQARIAGELLGDAISQIFVCKATQEPLIGYLKEYGDTELEIGDI